MTTSKPSTGPSRGAPDIVQFPDARPCDRDMSTYYYVNFPAYPSALADHFGNHDTTVIISELAAGLRPTESYEGILFPDLLIAFNADPAATQARNGYLIPEHGKPLDFVLEAASKTTGERDERHKRNAYAAMGVREYWRFDYTGGIYHVAPLAGDVLEGEQYRAIPVHRVDDEHYWGHSNVLNLDLCWEEGRLRFWDPVGRRYLTTGMEERAARRAAETARDAAEAMVRQLEEELRRRSGA